MRWLIDNKRLSEFKPFCPEKVDMRGAKSRGGDYTAEDIEVKMKPHLIGNTISHYRKICPNKRAIIFTYSIADSKNTVQAFNDAGIPAEHIDGTFSKEQRLAVLGRLERGETLVLSNVNLCIEGLSIKMIEACIIRRPTRSLNVYMQMIGRSLRYHPSKPFCYILDMVGNIEKLGFPDDEREWSLDSKPQKKKEMSALLAQTECKKCYSVIRGHVTVCPECGSAIESVARKVEVKSGELTEVQKQDLLQQKKLARMEVGQATTLKQYKLIGEQRGYKPSWAFIQWSIKQKRNSKRK
jgi:superfamily II DNA or RNA helicase